MAFKSAVENVKTWNKDLKGGEILEGYFVKVENVKSKFGENIKYIIEKDDGELIGIYSSSSLERQFNNVPINCYVRIEYKGEAVSSAGRTVKVYDIQYDDEKMKAF